MLPRSLYDVLGVEPGASQKTISDAHRKLAKQYHPDKNLNDVETATEVFKDIQLAFDILSDPMRRAHYDATGELVGKQSPEEIREREILKMVSEALDDALTQMLENGADPEEIDLHEVLMRHFKEKKKRLPKVIGDLENSIRKLQQTAKRWRSKKSPNEACVMQTVSLNSIQLYAAQLKHVKQDLELLSDVILFLKDFEFNATSSSFPSAMGTLGFGRGIKFSIGG